MGTERISKERQIDKFYENINKFRMPQASGKRADHVGQW
jgi:hypothetical protein